MRISGFTIVRNAVKFRYPFEASVRSILPLCDEFIINVGESDDGTLELARSLASPKVKIIRTVWNMAEGPTVLSRQTNAALAQCQGDWAFYLQSDEVIHEKDLPRLRRCMLRFSDQPDVDALRFRWLHFYGSYYRYRVDAGWYQKQDRIIRNNGTMESFGDAFGFKRKDGRPLRTRQTGCLLYHYGWVNSVPDMVARARNAAQIGYGDEKKERAVAGGYGDLNRFPAYVGTHPRVMDGLIEPHVLSQKDLHCIRARQWWNPLLWVRARYKTFRRERATIA